MESFSERNYYELLGIERDATPEQIKEAYKEIARVYHPDSNYYSEITEQGLNTDQIDIFKTITAAYHTLTNKQKRAEYDRTLAPDLKGWSDDTTDEDEEILAALEKIGVAPESVGIAPRKEPRKRKNSSAYGIFGSTPDAAAREDRPATQPAQFNQTSFGQGNGQGERARKKSTGSMTRATLTNLIRPTISSEEYKAAMPQPMMSGKQPVIPEETDKVKMLLIAFAGTGTICFVLSLVAFALLK